MQVAIRTVLTRIGGGREMRLSHASRHSTRCVLHPDQHRLINEVAGELPSDRRQSFMQQAAIVLQNSAMPGGAVTDELVNKAIAISKQQVAAMKYFR